MRWAVLLVLAGGMAGDVALGQPKGKSDATVDAWVQVLVKNIADRHDTVRDSARAALVSVGTPALPTLKKIAEGKDDAAAEAARKLIARIQGEGSPRVGPKGRAGFGGKPRFKKPEFKPGLGKGYPKGPPDGDGGKKPDKGRFDKGERKGFGGPKGLQLPGPFGKGINLSRLDPVSSALKSIKLSKEQQTKVDGIRKAYGDKTKEQLKEFTEAQKKLREGMLKDVKGVLTPEQLKEFEAAVKKGPGRKAAPGKGRKRGTSFELPGRLLLPRLEISVRPRRDAGANR